MRDFCGEIYGYLRTVTPLVGNLEELVGDGLLVDLLRRAVAGAKDAERRSLNSLENCWYLLTGEQGLGPEGDEIVDQGPSLQDWPELIRRLLFGGGGKDNASRGQCHTIHRHLKALIATAAAAFCLERKDRAFLAWLRRAAVQLDDATTYPDVFTSAMNPDGYAEELARAGWRIPGTVFWTEWWRGKQTVARTVEVPIAALEGETGHIMRLRLQQLPGSGHGLIRHPESAFHRFADDFLDPIQTLTRACDFPVCWSVRGLEGLPFRDRALQGRSASGAAARAVHDLWSGQVPDDGVLVLAQIALNGWDEASPDWNLIGLEKVEGDQAKFEEAKRDNAIMTVMMVEGGCLKVFERGNGDWAERAISALAQGDG